MQQKFSNEISVTALLLSGWCHINFSPVKIPPPCDAVCHQNSLTACFNHKLYCMLAEYAVENSARVQVSLCLTGCCSRVTLSLARRPCGSLKMVFNRLNVGGAAPLINRPRLRIDEYQVSSLLPGWCWRYYLSLRSDGRLCFRPCR